MMRQQSSAKFDADTQPTARREPSARPTEGGFQQGKSGKHKQAETQWERNRGRGRPKGSKNKPKALITKEIASELLGVVRQTLPPELYEEMKEAVRNGKNISTINEAKILMKLMGPPIWQRLIEEANQKPPMPSGFDPDLEDELGDDLPNSNVTPFNKDLNERVKVYMGLMQFVDKMERADDQPNNTAKPILEIFARRGVDGSRVDFLIGGIAQSVGGDADGTGRDAIEPRTVSGQVPERPLDVQDSQQVSAIRVLNDNSVGDDAQGGDES